MKPVDSPSVLVVVQSGGAEKTLHILQTLGPGPAAYKVEHDICMMADPWPDRMKTCLSVNHICFAVQKTHLFSL